MRRKTKKKKITFGMVTSVFNFVFGIVFFFRTSLHITLYIYYVVSAYWALAVNVKHRI